jgi:hypothetical protein
VLAQVGDGGPRRLPEPRGSRRRRQAATSGAGKALLQRFLTVAPWAAEILSMLGWDYVIARRDDLRRVPGVVGGAMMP